MRLWLAVMLGLSIAACSQSRPELSNREQTAVDRLTRDPWVDVISVQREGDSDLRVLTQQGDERIAYRVTFAEDGEAHFQRLPIVTFGR